MRNGLLIITALVFAGPGLAQAPMFPSGFPAKDNLPTIRYGSDLSHLAPPFNPTDYWPLTRLKCLGPGSEEAPVSYTGYGRVEWLFWWSRDQRPPPLLTTAEGSRLGGDLPYDNQFRQGTRLTLGWWLNNRQTLALEGTYLRLCRRGPNIVLGPGVERPFVDADSELSASDPALAARVANLSRLWGAEINVRAELARWTGGHVDLLAGARHLQVEESLEIAARGYDMLSTVDRFGSHNQFWGGQAGVEGAFNWGRLAVDLYGKLGLGVNHQVVDVEGSRVLGNSVAAGGFLAQRSNGGRHVHDPFSLLPEVGVHLAYRLTDNFRVSAGYSILWLTRTWRPGEQMEVTLSRASGASRPVFPGNDSTFWAQGINVGLEFRW